MAGLMRLYETGAQIPYLSGDPRMSYDRYGLPIVRMYLKIKLPSIFQSSTPIIEPPTIEPQKIQLRKLYLTVDFIKNIITMLEKHKYILLYQYHVNRILKNTECPITLNEITELYLECNTCKMCYDYNTTIHYFKSISKCAFCRQQININPLGVTNSSQIYVMLKKKYKLT